jgi:hypothetical protein
MVLRKTDVDAAMMMGCKDLSELAAMGGKVRELALRLEVAKKIGREFRYGNPCNRVDGGGVDFARICGVEGARKKSEA